MQGKYQAERGVKKKNRNLLIKGLLLLVFIGILSGTSYYVYYANKQATNTLNAANTEAQNSKPVKTNELNVKLTDSWTGYSNQEGSFNLKYPNNWVQPTYKRYCVNGTFDRTIYLGPNSSSVLKCGSQFLGQVYVASYIGDQRNEYSLNSDMFQNILTKTLGVQGVVGIKTTGIVNYENKVKTVAGLVNKDFVERYIFFTNGNTYVAQ